MQGVHHAQDLLDAQQVGDMLRVDRSTVYRMAETGRLPAAKIGRQWRFRPADIARLLEVSPPRPGLPPAAALQPLLDVTAHLLGVMLVVTDMTGRPVTDVANPCPWFAEAVDRPDLLSACVQEWEGLCAGSDVAPQWRTGRLGFDCARAFIRSGPTLIGMVLAGGVAARDDDPRELHRLDAAARDRVLSVLPDLAGNVARLCDLSARPDARSHP